LLSCNIETRTVLLSSDKLQMNPELIARTNGDSQHDPRNLSTLVEGTIEP